MVETVGSGLGRGGLTEQLNRAMIALPIRSITSMRPR
jgi:hypothetical protein